MPREIDARADKRKGVSPRKPAEGWLYRLVGDISPDDLIPERNVKLGGVAEGTVGVVVERSKLVDYPVARLPTPQQELASGSPITGLE